MPMKKKKFIDKKKAVTFRLVHRSQKDPLAADESAPQHVLLECGKHEKKEDKKRQEEQMKFGIYYDDDYNYLQHLRDVNEVYDWEPVGGKVQQESGTSTDLPTSEDVKVSLNLPSSVFQSHVEETEGMLNKAAKTTGPRPDWDPDIVAALDDDFDFENSENELEDDFITLANPSAMEEGSADSGSETSEGDDDSELSFESEETKSMFTHYSMSSSVLPRSENLQALDEHFEKFYEKYDDEEIGPLDCDDIQGYLKPDSQVIQQLVTEFTKSQNEGKLKELIVKQNQLAELEESESDSSEDELMEIITDEKPKSKWDCESIISTCSTMYNRPKLITEPKKVRPIQVSRNGLPVDALPVKGLTQHLLKKMNANNLSETTGNNNSISSRITVASTIRSKNETPEEKKERKAAVKQMRKERRAEKKANKLAFKEEEKRQEKVVLNLKQNLNKIKLL